MGNPKLIPYETIVRATSGEPEAVEEVLRHYSKRIRLAVNEGVDTGSGFDDDFLPFRDVINEYYAKDISKKIKSTFKAKGESGKHVASSPPYGYLKDSEDCRTFLKVS